MFFPTALTNASEEQGQSVSEYVEKKAMQKRAQVAKLRTLEDEEVAREFKRMDEEVTQLVEVKKKEFSFEVKPVL